MLIEKLYSTSSSSTHGFYEHEPDEMDIGFEILKENYRNSGHGSSPPSDETSLIEYGPGIVRKLRSKYQSLALRQYPSNSSSSSGRPNLLLLRRAASLENGLDEKGLELEESELPFPRSETQSPEKIQSTTIFTRSSRPTKTSNNKFHQNSNNKRRDENIENIEISTSVSRLRRARSVDILHTHHSQNQYETESNCNRNSKSHNTEEINEENQRILLAKFHSVVRPREEVIIIEMTHPKTNSNGPAPAVQPELPPPDIVRHTAQLFEPKATWKKLGNGIIATNTTCTNNQKRLNTMDNKKQKAYVLPQIQKSQSPSPIPPPSSNNKQQLQPPAIVSSKQQSQQPPHSPTRQIGIIRPTLQKFQGNNSTGLAKPPLSPKPQNFVISSSKFQRQSPSPAPTSPVPEPIQQALKKQSILIPKEDEAPVTVSKLPFQIQLKPVSKETVSLEKTGNFTPMTATAPRALSPVPAPSKEFNQFPIQKSIVSEESQLVPPEPKSTTKKLPIVSLLEKKEGEALKHGIKNLNNSIPSTNSTNLLPNKSQDSSQSQPPLSDLRSFQKRKSNETSSGHSNAMVFNFTKTRSKVPDYIEDDGSYGTADVLDGTNAGTFQILQFIGANIIINGRSSLQKKPKSQKKRIQFDEAGIQTFEYPSESSILNSDGEDVDSSCTGASGLLNNLVNNNGTNGGSGSGGLGSYTPSKSSFQTTSYQLGSYAPQTSSSGGPPVFKPYQNSSSQEEPSGDDDYLKPDTGSTTWSSEIGAADILF